MAETDVLNPTPSSPLNPDYGFQRKRPVTHLTAKANIGPAYMRELMDVMHQFELNWGTTLDSQKAYSEIQQLKQFYEQFRDGFFTLVDHDGGAREYVGRFITPIEPIHPGNNRWGAQQAIFEEVPGVPMRNYPDDWANDAIWRYTKTDFGELQPALDDPANWTLQACSGPGGGWEVVSNIADAYVQFAYIGYGFQLYSARDTDRGKAAITLPYDNLDLGTVDQYSAGGNVGAELLLTKVDLPLGLHLVRIAVTHTKNASSTGYTCSFNALKVMR